MTDTRDRSPSKYNKDNTQSPALRMPHNVDVERDVLGAMMLDNHCINEVMQIVKATDFYSPANQTVYQAIIDIYNDRQVVELTMLSDELKRRGRLDEAGGMLGLAQLEQNVLSTGAAPALAKRVADMSILRQLMQAAETILRECAEESREVDLQLDVAERRIFEIGQRSRTTGFVHITDLMADALTTIANLHANRGAIPGLPTHFRDLDGYLNGLHKGELIILAARPSIGKTAFAMNVALNVAAKEKTPVAVFSLEMGKEQLNMRLLCTYSRISSFRVQRGLIREREFQVLTENASDLQKVPIYIDDSPGLSLIQLRSRARRLAAQVPNLGLIVVDYLQLMTGSDRPGREQNRQQEVSEISRGLKALANELKVPVMALSQLSRNIEQRSGKDKSARPMLSDLRESGAIEQDADVVLFVHRERREVEKSDDGHAGDPTAPIETDIIIGKHRNGPIGTAKMLFWPDFTQFTDLEK